MSFGELLRSLRVQAGLSQEELAARAGLSARGVSALEREVRKRPYPHTVRVLAEALDLRDPQRASLFAAARPPMDQSAEHVGRTVAADALPVPVTAIVGRDEELAQIEALLLRGDVHLVTVTGMGGVGKTRLVIESARSASAHFPDGTAYVPLAPLSEPELVPSAVATALGIRHGGSGPAAHAVTAHLRDRHMLLVLDNFEHVLSAAPLVAGILAACPLVSVLVSSRARLRLRGEREVIVGPLMLPPATVLPTVEHVRRAPACRLLEERAHAADGSFALTAENSAAVAEVCRRLSGIPLALELAAPKVRTLGLDVLLERLEVTQHWQGARDMPARQQTLQAALDWSAELLSEEERVLFRRLSVFSGGFDLEAVEGVARELVEGDQHVDVIDVLDRLVEQSLVVVAPSGLAVRYTLLEPVRQYGRSLLHDAHEDEAVRRAHAGYFRRLARRAEREFYCSDQLRWLTRVDRETDNFQSAVARCIEARDGDWAADIAWALRLHWWQQGLLDEVSRWMDEALGLNLSPSARIRALFTKAKMAHGCGDFATAVRLLREATEIARRLGDLHEQVQATTLLGLVAIDAGEPAQAIELLCEAVDLGEGLDDEVLTSTAAIWLGSVLLAEGDAESAGPLLGEGQRLARRRGDRLVMNEAVLNLASSALSRHEDEEAARLLKESAALSLETQDRPNLAFALEGLVVVESRRKAWWRCVVMLGAARSLRLAVGGRYYNYYVPDSALIARAESLARSALGEEAFDAYLSDGMTMDARTAAGFARS